MKIPVPKRQWFALALPSAWLVAWLILFVRIMIQWEGWNEGIESRLGTAAIIGVLGLHQFPLGLAAYFVWSKDFLIYHHVLISAIGYSIYASLTVFGLIKPHRIAFIVLSALLLMNIAGCQLEHSLYAALQV